MPLTRNPNIYKEGRVFLGVGDDGTSVKLWRRYGTGAKDVAGKEEFKSAYNFYVEDFPLIYKLLKEVAPRLKAGGVTKPTDNAPVENELPF